MSIDGSHDGEVPYYDIRSLRPSMTPRTVLVSDDSFPYVESGPTWYTKLHSTVTLRQLG